MTSSPKLSPYASNRLVDREDGRRVFVASTHELEEELRAGARDGEIPYIIVHHETRKHQRAQSSRDMSGLLRIFDAGDEIGELCASTHVGRTRRRRPRD